MMDATVESGSQDNREAAALEREGDAIRADMGRTLDALEQKFSPDRLIERSIGLLRENGSEVMREIGQTVRQHPLPILLAGAGLIWLTSSLADARQGSGTRSSSQKPRTQAASAHASRRDNAGAKLISLVQEQPLAIGALAVAAGALVGAALPISSYETELLSQAREPAQSDSQSTVQPSSQAFAQNTTRNEQEVLQ